LIKKSAGNLVYTFKYTSHHVDSRKKGERETKSEIERRRGIGRGGASRGDDDDASLFALELFDRPHVHLLHVIGAKRQAQLLHLPVARRVRYEERGGAGRKYYLMLSRRKE
jgi:hypothetical protein